MSTRLGIADCVHKQKAATTDIGREEVSVVSRSLNEMSGMSSIWRTESRAGRRRSACASSGVAASTSKTTSRRGPRASPNATASPNRPGTPNSVVLVTSLAAAPQPEGAYARWRAEHRQQRHPGLDVRGVLAHLCACAQMVTA